MIKLLAMLAVILLAGPGVSKVGAQEVTVDLFYRSLEPHGEWIETADYGYVWHPREVAENWRPYTVGSWAYTDAGWTWVSEEPFGWATYHYGRWVRIEPTGWVWVPDTQWAPAWVSWRRSPKYVGWAPLPPEARFRRTVGIQAWADTYYDIGPEYYSFVEVREFGSPRLVRAVLPPRENVTIIRESKNITNITVVNNYVFNGGPEYEVIVRESVAPVRRLRIERRMDIAFEPHVLREDVLRTTIAGDTLRIIAPDVRFVANARPARVARRVERVQVDRGWKMANVERRQLEQLRAEIRKEAPKPPAQLPPEPKFERAIADVPGEQKRERRDRHADEPERLSVPGTPAGATVGAPGAEDTPAGRTPARKETPPDAAPSTAPADAEEKDRAKRRDRMERERPETTETAPSATMPDAATTPPTTTRDSERARTKRRERPETTETAPSATMPDAATTPPATTRDSQRDRTKRRDREQPGGMPETKTPDSETATPDASDRAKKRERRERSQREQPGATQSRTPATAMPDAEQAPRERTRRGARDAEASPATRPERSDRSPEATTPGDRPQTSRERRSPSEDKARTEREERSNRSQREARPDRSERGAGRPERSAPERARDAGEREQSRANRPERQQGERERRGGGSERQGGRRGGAEGVEGAGARDR